MKQKDIALIIVVVFVSGALSFFISGLAIGSATTKQKGLTVDVISPVFMPPDATYFNKNSIDPTQLIHIGTGSNPNPFGAR